MIRTAKQNPTGTIRQSETRANVIVEAPFEVSTTERPKQMSVEVPKRLHAEVKLRAFRNGVENNGQAATMNDLIVRYVREGLARDKEAEF